MWKTSLAVFVIVIIFGIENGFACSCGRMFSTSQSYFNSDSVFVGKVIKTSREVVPPSTEQGSGTGVASPPIYTIEVKMAFKGIETDKKVTVKWKVCGFQFDEGETYLIFASVYKGEMFVSGVCPNTRLFSNSTEQIKYIEGINKKSQQTLVSGEVFHQILDKDGKLGLQVPFEELKLIAESKKNRNEATVEKFGWFEIVLVPDDYQIWVERKGKRVSQIKQLSVIAGESKNLLIVVDF